MSDIERHFLHSFFYPESVAVVGASSNQKTLNYNFIANLVNLKYRGKIYPVNPNAEEILGMKVYPSLKNIEGNVDLAVISVPVTKALDVLRDCVAKKVKNVVLIPGGFAEIGESGRRLQDEVLRLLRDNGIRAIGPNTLSPINADNNFTVSFRSIKKLPRGRISFIFQSGLYDPRINWLLSEFHMYLSKLIDLGNKMDVNEVDALEYLGQDPETEVIAMHLEGIAGDARELLRLLKRISMEKPVIVLKSGRTEAGAKAAASHTGSIIRASDAVFDAACKQAGVVRAQSLDEFFDLAKIFEYLYPMKGNRIHVSTGPGGEGVLTTDQCYYHGLTMAKLGEEAYNKLRTVFPPWEISANPLDLGICGQFNSGMDVGSVIVDAVAGDENVDCIALQGRIDRFIKPEEFLRVVSETVKRGKPVAIWMTVMPQGENTIVDQMEARRIPVFPSAERAIRALAALHRYYGLREAIRGE
ncbi:MAG: CoA-binding protein [Chloroflexi bacterium]|nr:CoA-binding protein [Chloroflexota bacterium]